MGRQVFSASAADCESAAMRSEIDFNCGSEVLAGVGFAERLPRVLGKDEGASGGPVDQARQLEAIEVQLRLAVEKLLLGPGDLEARALDLEVGAAPLPLQDRGPAQDRLARLRS